MFYDAYQVLADIGDSVASDRGRDAALLAPWAKCPYASPIKRMAAFNEVLALAGFTHKRPDYGIKQVEIARRQARGDAKRSPLRTPFCDLLRFVKEGGEDDPNVLLIAPMSGHFATLLRGTLRTLLARPPSLHHRLAQSARRKARIRTLRPRGLYPARDRLHHVTSATNATSSRSASPASRRSRRPRSWRLRSHNVQPASLTLMAGPIDVRIAPNTVNKLANDKPL